MEILVAILIVIAGASGIVAARASSRRTKSEAEASQARQERDTALEDRETARQERETAARERDEARAHLSTAQQHLAAAYADQRARAEELEKARKQIEDNFRGLAAGVLKENTDMLLRTAREQFEGQSQLSQAELEKRKQAIDSLVTPIQKSLEKLGEHANELEQKRAGAYEGLKTQIDSLQRVAGSLSEALRSPNIRGQWAEHELANILELSGLQEHIDFRSQQTVDAAGGKLRPDAVVNVPGGLKVVIDAKAPLSSYLDAHEANDDRRERESLEQHASALSGHAKELGRRDYSQALNCSPDFVLMFVPADPILDSAMKVRPRLWEQAWQDDRVLIATPGLLLAFLRTVALAWKQQNIEKQAQEIADLGKELHTRLQTFSSYMANVGKGLSRALREYNAAVGSLEGRVLVQARRFEELQVASELKPIANVQPLDGAVRQMSVAYQADVDALPSRSDPLGSEEPSSEPQDSFASTEPTESDAPPVATDLEANEEPGRD